jgi:hypothetical protein
MATRKKKEVVEVAEVPVRKLTPIAKREKKEMKIFKPVVKEPTVVKGSHLTITYNSEGYPEKLEWDDAQLLKDVQEAIASAEIKDMKPAVRAKAVTRKKKEKTNG